MATSDAQLLKKTLCLLRLIVADQGASALSVIANAAGLPVSTAHRIVATLVDQGMLIRIVRGRYAVGPVAAALASPRSLHALMKLAAEPILTQISRDTGHIAQLGVFEDGMVTYLIKSGDGSDKLFTREDMSLEAYCSALGKILLSHLPPRELEEYLLAGPFVALTPNTSTDPEDLRRELVLSRERGYSIDNCEITTNLWCVAAPIFDLRGRVIAALSLSSNSDALLGYKREGNIAALKEACSAISESLFSHSYPRDIPALDVASSRS